MSLPATEECPRTAPAVSDRTVGRLAGPILAMIRSAIDRGEVAPSQAEMAHDLLCGTTTVRNVIRVLRAEDKIRIERTSIGRTRTMLVATGEWTAWSGAPCKGGRGARIALQVPSAALPQEARVRACLRCRKDFHSLWAGHRICGRCKEQRLDDIVSYRVCR